MITCKFENGDKVLLRHVCVNAIVVKDGRVLLGKRGTYKGRKILESGKWALLGGFLDRDENMVKAVVREVLEESGWEVYNIRLFRINDNPNRPGEDRQNVDVIFLARAVKEVGEFDEEVTELKWFDIDNLPPVNKIAFDHADSLTLYKKYLKKKFNLPIFDYNAF
jgi:8-oxo-dGTP diphosphatase